MSQGRRRRMSQLSRRVTSPSSTFCCVQALKGLAGTRSQWGGGSSSLRLRMQRLVSSGHILTGAAQITFYQLPRPPLAQLN